MSTAFSYFALIGSEFTPEHFAAYHVERVTDGTLIRRAKCEAARLGKTLDEAALDCYTSHKLTPPKTTWRLHQAMDVLSRRRVYKLFSLDDTIAVTQFIQECREIGLGDDALALIYGKISMGSERTIPEWRVMDRRYFKR